MMFESNYRELALDAWEHERTMIEQELSEKIRQKQWNPTNPLLYLLACFVAWLNKS